MYGRGACDMKGGIAICIEAILNVLGASGGNVHVNNEYATLESLEDRVEILEKIITEFWRWDILNLQK